MVRFTRPEKPLALLGTGKTLRLWWTGIPSPSAMLRPALPPSALKSTSDKNCGVHRRLAAGS